MQLNYYIIRQDTLIFLHNSFFYDKEYDAHTPNKGGKEALKCFVCIKKKNLLSIIRLVIIISNL